MPSRAATKCPTDPAEQAKLFGYGWYKYAPDVAEKLLIKNGFSKNADGKWLLPDGTPWTIKCLTGTNVATDMGEPQLHGRRPAVEEVWHRRRRVFDREYCQPQRHGRLRRVRSNWPAQEPWGAGPDLYRVLDYYNSAYVKPVGDTTNGHPSRWSSPEMDAVIEKLRQTDPADYQAVVDVGIEGLKVAVEEMPGIPTFGYIGFITWDQQYWKNWPGSENAYSQPYPHWGPFKYQTPFLEPTGNAVVKRGCASGLRQLPES